MRENRDLRSRGVRLLLSGLGLALLAAALFVAASVTGRGTRSAVGERAVAASAGRDIVYYDGGAGPAVVLLASWARPVSDFNELARALHGAGFRTLAVESRGIGGSDGGGPSARPTLADLASDVVAVLDATGTQQPVHLVGHAFGNRVARTFASRYRDRTRSVALVAAGGRDRIAPELTEALFVSSLSFLPWSLREAALRRAFFAEGNEVPRYWRTGWSLWGGLAQDHAARSGRSEDFWGAGGAPMLVFQADQDTIAPPEEAGLALQRDFPERVTLIPIADAGHALLPEQPRRIAAGLVSYLRSAAR